MKIGTKKQFFAPSRPNFATLIFPNIQLSKKNERAGVQKEFGTIFLLSFEYMFGTFF